MDRKHIILDVLKRSNRPLSLFDIYKAVKESIPERSLRRYLNELQAKREVTILGSNRNRRYRAIQVFPDAETEHHIFSSQSLVEIAKLKVPLYQRDPCPYNIKFLEAYEPNRTFYFSVAQRDALYKYGKRANDEEPAGTIAHKIYERLLIDLSYNSSRLEGNTYSLLDTRRLLLEGKIANDKLDSEKTMILNHKDAIGYLANHSEDVLNVDSIRTLHYLLSDGLVPPELSGKFRNEPVKVSGSVYIPIDNIEKIDVIFNKIINKANRISDPFEQSIFLLVHISYLQAFVDVNKRIARLASNIPLLANNLIPISFADIDMADYRSAIIAIYEFNVTSPLVDLYLWSYIRTAKEYAAIIESYGFDSLRIKYRPQRRSLLSQIIKENIHHEINHKIKAFAAYEIPSLDQEKFIHDVVVDLQNIDVAKIAGLGVSKEEFLQWFKDRDNNYFG